MLIAFGNSSKFHRPRLSHSHNFVVGWTFVYKDPLQVCNVHPFLLAKTCHSSRTQIALNIASASDDNKLQSLTDCKGRNHSSMGCTLSFFALSGAYWKFTCLLRRARLHTQTCERSSSRFVYITAYIFKRQASYLMDFTWWSCVLLGESIIGNCIKVTKLLWAKDMSAVGRWFVN